MHQSHTFYTRGGRILLTEKKVNQAGVQELQNFGWADIRNCNSDEFLTLEGHFSDAPSPTLRYSNTPEHLNSCLLNFCLKCLLIFPIARGAPSSRLSWIPVGKLLTNFSSKSSKTLIGRPPTVSLSPGAFMFSRVKHAPV